MTFEMLQQVLMTHKLLHEFSVVGAGPQTKLVGVKCSCGAPFLRDEQWARHVAEIIVMEGSE